jgi:hypothetical protein
MQILLGVLLVAQFSTTLEQKTVQAFEEYMRGVDASMTARAAGAESLAGRPEGIFGNTMGKEGPGGMVHDWAAVAFLPGVKKERAIAVLEDFSKHASIYPEVLIGRTDKREGSRIYAFHRVRKKKVLEVTLEAKYLIELPTVPANRYASKAQATEIVEIQDAGKANEKRLPPGKDRGFLWRLHTYWTLEETPQGLWMEVRSVSITRYTPVGLGCAVRPFVKDLPRESLEGVMAATKKAILAGQ